MKVGGGGGLVFIYWPQVSVTPSQIPAFELTKVSAKFEVAMSNRLGKYAFTRKYIISLLTLTLGQGKKETLPSILYNIWPMHLQSLKLLCPTV